MKLIQKLINQIVVFLLILSTIILSANVVKANEGTTAKELSNVISGINILDVSEGKPLTPDENGEYKLYENKSYRYETSFDLKKYDGKLNDGDYFTFTIPSPFNVNDGATVPLIDSTTNLEVGTAVVTQSSLGQGKGGTVKVTLKNLSEYLKKKGGVQVQDVKGTFYTDFNSSETIERKEINYKVSETIKPINHTIKILKREKSDYTEGIKNENFIKFGGILNTKDPYDSKILGKKGEYAHSWILRVNTNQSSYDKIVLKDQILDSYAPMQHIPEKFSVVAGAFDSTLNLQNRIELKRDIDYTIEYNKSYTEYTLTILNANKRLVNGKPASYNVFYKTTSPADGSIVGNKIEVTGDGKPLTIGKDTTKTEHIVTRSSKIVEGGNITIDTGYRIMLYKTDEETGKLLPGAKFKITTPSGKTSTITTDENGRAYSEVYSSDEVNKGEFTIEEVEAPLGYEKITEPIKVTIGKEGVIKTIKNKRIKTEIPVRKEWDDNNNKGGVRPQSVQVQLYADNMPVDGKVLILSADNNWSGKFTGLDKYDKDTGEEIFYDIREVDVDEHYVPAIIMGNASDGYVLINQIKTTSLAVNKEWVDGDDTRRPQSVQVQLYANGVAFGNPQTLDENNYWEYLWNDLPIFENGQKIVYTIKEVTQVPGYVASGGEVKQGHCLIPVDAFGANDGNCLQATITNTRVIDIAGEKTWDDGNNQDGKRPEKIKVNLLADGEIVQSKEVSEKDNWKYTFENLPKYKEGKLINYTITEDKVYWYETEIKDYSITNKYTPETIQVSGTKTWEDNNNQDGKRPEKIKVNLLANGEIVQSKEVSEKDNWKYTFENLPKYKEGKLINYTITEDKVYGYETEIKDYNITNKYTPETIQVSGTKTWEDNNNQDGKRPEKIKVNLLANGEIVQSKEVSEKDNWKYTFENLPKYKEGKLINYTITEDKVDGYETEIKDYNITNKYTPETIQVSGTKTWEDNNNQDGKRPEKIKVNLLANGEIVQSKEVSEKDNWKYTFENLPKYKEGKLINYTITEDKVDGYETEIKDYNITNKYTPELTQITGEKTWKDNNNQDGKRPDKIKVNLLADGQIVQNKEVSEKDNWKYTFTNLPKYKEGKLINYTITEDKVDGYETEIKGYNITNKYIPKIPNKKLSKTGEYDSDYGNLGITLVALAMLIGLRKSYK